MSSNAFAARHRSRGSPASESSSSSTSTSSGSSTPSSSRDASSSSEVSPPSSTSSTPPNADSRASSKSNLELAQSSSAPASQQQQTAFTTSHLHAQAPGAIPRTDSESSIRTVTTTPLFAPVQTHSLRNVGEIQTQVEAALSARARDTRRSEKTMNAQNEGNLRSRLAATSSRDYYDTRMSSEGAGGSASQETITPRAASRPTMMGVSSSFEVERVNTEAAKREAAETDMIDRIIAQGRQKAPRTGESLIDAVMAHHAQWMGSPAPSSSAPYRGASSTARPGRIPVSTSMPIRQHTPVATKHMPYGSLASFAERARKSGAGSQPQQQQTSSSSAVLSNRPAKSSVAMASNPGSGLTASPSSTRRSR